MAGILQGDSQLLSQALDLDRIVDTHTHTYAYAHTVRRWLAFYKATPSY